MQTSYNLTQAESFAGMKADSRFDEVESFLANEEIAFGRGLMANASDKDLVEIADNASGVFRGVSVHIHNEDGVYAEKDAVSTLRKGKIWVETADAVVEDSAAYIDVAGGLGKFTDASASNLATGGVFRSATAAAGLALVEINIPNT